MTRDEWESIALVLDKGFKWRERFDEIQGGVYRTLLEGYDAGQVLAAIRGMVAKGQVFGPTPGEIVALLRIDPDRPTFTEMLALVFGRGGVLAARAPSRPSWEAGERERADREAMAERVVGLPPLVAAFVHREGLDRLRQMNLEGEFGGIRRRELEASWQAHCAAMEDRDVAAIATGRRGEMGRVDFAAVIAGARSRPALEAGE